MKLIVTGATGFVGTEVIRQSLARDDITTVVAVARKPVTAPDGVGADKLRSVVIPDYPPSAVDYPDEARREFAGANGCIWYYGLLFSSDFQPSFFGRLSYIHSLGYWAKITSLQDRRCHPWSESAQP